MKIKIFPVVLICLAFILSAGFTVFSFVREIKQPTLPVLGRIQPFTLTDSNGNPFHSDQLRGKVWVANFFFTTCSDICPVLSKEMSSLSRSFGSLEKVSLVSVTVNPEQDTPETLARYAGQFGGVNPNWHFLTGSREAITDLVVNGFKVGDIREPVFHSAHFPLVDADGFIRGYYDGTDPEALNRLLQDAAFLASRP